MSAQNQNRPLLREASPDDAGPLSVLRGDIELQHVLMAHPIPVDPLVLVAGTAEWIKRRVDSDWFRIIDDGTAAIGFVQITDIHSKNRSAWLGIALTPANQGKKFGKAALAEAELEARVQLGLRKLMLQVRCDNHRAIRLYEQSGWRTVGTFLAHYDDGEAKHDVIVMEKAIL